jgi:Pregnancy-associated plasma protein-A
MRIPNRLTLITTTALALVGAALLAGPAASASPEAASDGGCFVASGAGLRAAAVQTSLPRRTGADTRHIGPREQASIAARTRRLLRGQGAAARAGVIAVPVYVHVMLSKSGVGDVTQAQIDDQIAVLNTTYAGGEDAAAADTGVSFTLAGVDRYYNNNWHQDHQTLKYRRATRQGGADALNVWLVDFAYLGIATFPWDYAKRGAVDGIRVHFDSVPGGSIPNYNLGETATHEAGHWLGLYHTFQGGCGTPNDEVSDTPAQSSPTTGCPVGRDSCTLPGLDPIHNYMDYSYDTCYTEFTAGQSDRITAMWAAYRA